METNRRSVMAECPRCKLKLQNEKYENADTLFCSLCWGHWMTKDAFSQVLESERYTFSDAEKESVLRNWAEKSDPDVNLDPVVNCPVCNSATEKKPFSDDCPVVLDLCHEHGVWLDASEIKQVQVYFDSLN